MTNQQTKTSSRYPHFTRVMIVCVLTLILIGLSGWSTNLFSHSVANAASASPTATNVPIKVFFSKYPDSVNKNFAVVFPVNRSSSTVAVGTFAVQLLIAGPTLDERHVGYFSELNSMLSGPSNCTATLPIAGPDFTLTLNKKGSQNTPGTATLQFCRAITSAGIGSDARVQAEIDATLKQFPTIKKVVILTKDGHCFADESGQDHCLR
ncbi:MAG: hypothetical protein NVS4B12_10980 [Ktedonobacteraceae bacterium]